MTWIEMSPASLAPGVTHLFVSARYRAQQAHLLFFVRSAPATAFGSFEPAMMPEARALRLVAKAHLCKPVDDEALLAAIGGATNSGGWT